MGGGGGGGCGGGCGCVHVHLWVYMCGCGCVYGCGCHSYSCNSVAAVSKEEDKNIATFDVCSVAEYYCRVDDNEETKCEYLYDRYGSGHLGVVSNSTKMGVIF